MPSSSCRARILNRRLKPTIERDYRRDDERHQIALDFIGGGRDNRVPPLTGVA